MNRELRAKLIKRITTVLNGWFNGDGLTLLLKDVRMLLEDLGEAELYPSLKLHCDWVLHSELSGPKVRKILRDFDSHWGDWISHQIPFPEEFANSLPYNLGFVGFEKEFIGFLSKYGVKFNPFEDRAKWHAFELLYCSLVKDTRFRYKDRKKPLQHINGAKVRMYPMSEHPHEGKDYRPGDYLPYGIEWTFTMNDEPVWFLTSTYPSKQLLEREEREKKIKEMLKPPPRS